MQAAVRPYVMAGVAIAGASLIAVTPVAPPPDLHRVANASVRLADASTDLLGGIESLANLGGGVGDLGGLANVPVNLFDDIVNIPYSESLALQEYASALGPAGNLWGVPGWIPPGANVADGGVVDNAAGQAVYALGGTGSYYYESLGNTWGWDDGNFPQLDGIISALLPFPSFTQPLVDQIQTFAQAEIIDGASVDCEFECASWEGYLGSWFHAPITELLSGTYKYPTVLEDTVGGDGATSATGVINSGGMPFMGNGQDVIWSGQTAQLNPLAPFESFANSLTATPTGIEIPNVTDVITNSELLSNDITTDFNPFETGSFLYWGAPTDYSIPSLMGGMLQNFTGIPNQFHFPVDQPLGAEPLNGYLDGPSYLLSGLPQGFEYLAQGLLGYLNPETYLAALSNDGPGTLLGTLTNPTELLNDIPFLGLLFDPSTFGLGSLDLSTLAGSADASTLGLASLGDPTALLGSLDPGTIAGDLSALLPSSVANLVPDLALQLLTSF